MVPAAARLGPAPFTLAPVQHLLNIVRGFLMGSADIVPGVSGGTVALVLGIYERLVHNIRTGAGALGSLLRGRWSEARRRLGEVEWWFLVPLLLGIGLAILTLAALIRRLLDVDDGHPIETVAVFFGLVVGSIAIAWRLVRRWDGLRYAALVLVSAAAFVLLGLRSGEVRDPALWAFCAAGVVAIVAMILPGISGSFILLMLGMYEAVLAAVDDRDLPVLVVFGIGAVLSLAAFSTLLDRLLSRHHDTVLAVLIGLMIGSLRVLWPWPAGNSSALGRPQDWGLPLLLALAAAAAVLGLGWLSRHSAGSGTDDPKG